MAWPPGFEPAGEAWPTGFAAPQPVNRREMARQEIALGGVDDSGVPSRDKSTQLQWFETKIRPALEQIAHPQTVNDFAALLIPDIRLSKANVAAMMEAVKKLPVPTGRQVLSAYKAVRHPARTIATAIGETPQPAEASNAMELIRRGKSPGEAVVNIISHRRPMETPPSAPSAGV